MNFLIIYQKISTSVNVKELSTMFINDEGLHIILNLSLGESAS